jgi:hypothetical protein
MFALNCTTRVFLKVGATDLRLGFDGLHGQVVTILKQDVLSGHVFGFRVDPFRYTGRTLSLILNCEPPPLRSSSLSLHLHRRAVSRGCGRSAPGRRRACG